MPLDPIGGHGCDYSTIECHPRRSTGSFFQLWDSKCSFSVLASIPIGNMPVLDVVLLSDRQVIFSTPPKQRFSVLFWAKRTSDSSSAPQNCLGSIYLFLSGHLSLQETSKQPRCTWCHVRNVFFRTCMLTPICFVWGFLRGKFDVCYVSPKLRILDQIFLNKVHPKA